MPLHPESPHFTRALSESLEAWFVKHPDVRDVLSGQDIHFSADFGQDDPRTPFQAYTFAVVPASQLESWKVRIEGFRNEIYQGGGRFEFKKLGDPVRLRHLPEFLRLCGMLPGVTITLLVPRSVRWAFLWHGSETGVPSPLLKETFGMEAKPHIAEKIMRIVHGVIGILGSIPTIGRWVTLHVDRDAAVNEVVKFTQLGQGLLASNFGRDVRHLAVVRDEGSKGPDADLLAIPDLVCGAITEIHNRANGAPHIPSEKTAGILSWMTAGDAPLKHLVLRYELAAIDGIDHAQWFRVLYRPSPEPPDPSPG